MAPKYHDFLKIAGGYIFLVANLCVFLFPSSSWSEEKNAPKAPVGNIRIPVENIRHLQHGELIAVLFKHVSRINMDMEKAYKIVKALPAKPRMVLNFKNIPYGEYAVGVFHDLKKNNEMDTNFFGFPKEDSAISQNAKGGPLGGPKWEDAKFLLKVQELTLDPLKIYRFGPDEID